MPRQSMTTGVVGCAGGDVSYWNCRPVFWGAADLRLMLDDFDKSIPLGSDSRKAIVNLVQRGIDYYALALTGTDYTDDAQGPTDGTAVFPQVVISAYLLGNQAMRAHAAGTSGAFPGGRVDHDTYPEPDYAYIGAGGVGFLGHPYANRPACAFGKWADTKNFDVVCSKCLALNPDEQGMGYTARWLSAIPYQFAAIAFIARRDPLILDIFNSTVAMNVVTSFHGSTPGRGYGTSHRKLAWCGAGDPDNNTWGALGKAGDKTQLDLSSYATPFGDAVIAQGVAEGKWPNLASGASTPPDPTPEPLPAPTQLSN
jgi:hypothetical protein